MTISGKISGKNKPQKIEATVQLNTPNFIFVKTSTTADKKLFEKFSSLSVNFRPLRQKMVYQFKTDSQGSGANALRRIVHSDDVKILEEI